MIDITTPKINSGYAIILHTNARIIIAAFPEIIEQIENEGRIGSWTYNKEIGMLECRPTIAENLIELSKFCLYIVFDNAKAQVTLHAHANGVGGQLVGQLSFTIDMLCEDDRNDQFLDYFRRDGRLSVITLDDVAIHLVELKQAFFNH